MGRIVVRTRVTNLFDEEKSVECGMFVDTGAGALILPRAWKARLGRFKRSEVVELQMADREVVRGEACWPVEVRIEGFRPVSNEVIFVDMKPEENEEYEPLLGVRHPGAGASGGRHARPSSGPGEVHRHEMTSRSGRPIRAAGVAEGRPGAGPPPAARATMLHVFTLRQDRGRRRAPGPGGSGARGVAVGRRAESRGRACRVSSPWWNPRRTAPGGHPPRTEGAQRSVGGDEKIFDGPGAPREQRAPHRLAARARPARRAPREQRALA